MPTISIAKNVLRLVLPELVAAIAKIAAQRVACENIENSIRNQYLPMLETWKGDAGDAYRAEVQNRLLVEINAIKEALGGIRTNCETGQATIENTDKKCVSYSDQLKSTYASIIKW